LLRETIAARRNARQMHGSAAIRASRSDRERTAGGTREIFHYQHGAPHDALDGAILLSDDLKRLIGIQTPV
jgi:hypothetical protein